MGERVLTENDIEVIRERFHGWEKASASTLATVFGVSVQRITAIVRPTPIRTPPMNDLIERIEAASGPDREIDLAIAEYAFDQQIPLSCYGGRPINYDPRMWLERHEWSPTASIDTALTLVPEWFEWCLEYQAGHHVRFESECMIAIAKLGDPCFDWESTAATPALALCAAALRARKDHQ